MLVEMRGRYSQPYLGYTYPAIESRHCSTEGDASRGKEVGGFVYSSTECHVPQVLSVDRRGAMVERRR